MRRRSLFAVAGLVCAALVLALSQIATAAAAAPLSIAVSGNHFVNGAGQTVRLLGVNQPSFEYACDQGYAYNDEHFDDAEAAAVASWNASAVRVPLNQSCWLGINGDPSNSQAPDPPLTVAGYREAVQSYVAALNAHGLYAILDLHWTGPGAERADGQRPMPDDHSAAFWESVATTFKSNPGVVFDLFNEPYSPADVFGEGAPAVSWQCWRDGGCQLPVSNDSVSPPSKTLYTAVGMQSLVNAVRATGATQPVLIGGLDYANDLTQWLSFAPKDPLGQEAASFHNYQLKACDNLACWSSTIAEVAAQVPVVTGEFDEEICLQSGFDEEYMSWADRAGVGYLAWGWWVLTPQEIAAKGCKAYYLLSDYNGTPASANGTAVHDHLAKLPAHGLTLGPPAGGGSTGGRNGQQTGIRLTKFKATVKPGGRVSFQLLSPQGCNGVLSGKTAKPFAIASAKPKRHKVSLGTVNFKLVADKPKVVTLKLSKPAAQLLAANGKLKASFTITLSSPAAAKTVLHHTVTLKPPAKRHTH